jgi:hypothetical protein
VKLFLKITLGIIVLIALSMVVFANLGGNGEWQKSGVESLISEVTGYHAKVAQLNDVQFYPTILFDFEKLTLHKTPDTEKPLAWLGAARMEMNFWDMFSGNGKVKTLRLSGLQANADVLTPKPLTLNTLDINQDGTQFTGSGTMGETPFTITIPAESFPEEGTYKLAPQDTMTLSAADFTLTGNFDPEFLGGLRIRDLTLNRGENPVLQGNIVFKADDAGTAFELSSAHHETKFSGDYSSGNTRKLSLKVSTLDMQDFEEDSNLLSALLALEETIFPQSDEPDPPINPKPMQVHVNVENVTGNVLNLKGFSGDLTWRDQNLDIQITSNHEEEGLYANITGQGETRQTLLSSLHGDIRLVIGESNLGTGVLNLWGGGLLNAMIPSFDQNRDFIMNCGILDFKLTEGIAETQTLFMDTDRVQVAGQGTYNFPNDQFDITMKPKPKSIAIGDLSSAVKITGPVSDVQISPSVAGLGIKLGELLLGTVNPLFLAYSLTDLGLSRNHACASYIRDPDMVEEPAKETQTSAP